MHQFGNDSQRLEDFLKNLEGEVDSIIPNNNNLDLAQFYGLARRNDFLLIVEKTS